MANNIITKVSTLDAIRLGKIEGLKAACKDAAAFMTDNSEREFYIKYLELQIKNLEAGFGERNTILREG